MPLKKTLEKNHIMYHKDGSIWAKREKIFKATQIQ